MREGKKILNIKIKVKIMKPEKKEIGSKVKKNMNPS